MNNANLKTYAPQARKDFIAAVSARANLLGVHNNAGVLEVALAETHGDITVIAGQAWSSKVNDQRNKLIERIRNDGFEQTMEAVAYTWFNRFAALRYMELHDYLGHGYRALSSEAGGMPEILTHAMDVSNDLPGLDTAKVTEFKLAGNRDGELYRMLLVAQCNALSKAMPFLFERIDDDSELLLPDNLLRSDSVISKLIDAIPEEDWGEVEIIGWLYQYYIADKKDQVIGKVVKSEDIPAATQLFTPNWIVKYMVQNSLGAQWLATYPLSPLKGQMEYYIEPAVQSDEVNSHLETITPSQLNLEELTLIDPACGSGHILVEAYELFKVIYLERGYRQRDIPKLILEKNLFGLDIDDRASQLTGFTMMMKGRADDRQLFEKEIKLNVMAMENSALFDPEVVASCVDLENYGLSEDDLADVKLLFENATTFGSLIQVPEKLKAKLHALEKLSDLTSQDLFVSESLKRLGPLVQQAKLLASQYDAVVANPPYMGSGGMNAAVKNFCKDYFPDAKTDLFTCFIERACNLSKDNGRLGAVAPYVWMFLTSYRNFREQLLSTTTLSSLIQLEYNAFEPACVPVAAFTRLRRHIPSFLGSYIKLSKFTGHQNQAPRTLEAIKNPECGWFYQTKPDEFRKIPGSPIAYSSSENFLSGFQAPKIGSLTSGKGKNVTADNERFLRFWWEVDSSNVGRNNRWLIYAKGGSFRKWSGNLLHVCDWGPEAHSFYSSNPSSSIIDSEYWYRKGVTWTVISSSTTGFRMLPVNTTFDTKGLALFFDSDLDLMRVLLLTNSIVGQAYLRTLNQTFCINTIDVKGIPCIPEISVPEALLESLISISSNDWNSYAHSWEFQTLPILQSPANITPSLESSYTAWIAKNRETIFEMKRLEEENNRFFINAYGLIKELSPEVPIEQITLTVNPAYRYGGKLTSVEQWTRFSQETMEELISYAIGCMMGRYSLDEPGLIYAHAGNVGFEPGRYASFPADPDGIVPITEELWFADDAPSRIREFLQAVWGPDTLEKNMTWLAESLGTKASETPDESIRRYIADKFFKDHLQTYKKRPIYWLFSSGKQGAFQALVYLHRYNEGTLARLRAEYVVPLTSKIQSRIEMQQKDAEAASSTAARNRMAKEVEKLKKKHVELLAYDEQLRHYADMRITLDLNDGVKVNYGKFGDLLAEVKAVTGGASDD